MADDTTIIRKKSTAPYDNKLNPTRTKYKPVSEKQRQLWQALYDYITQQGGWTVSVPGLKRLRFEIPPGSALPSKLSFYDPRHIGTRIRLTPGAHFTPVDIVEITLPGA